MLEKIRGWEGQNVDRGEPLSCGLAPKFGELGKRPPFGFVVLCFNVLSLSSLIFKIPAKIQGDF